MFTHEDNRRTLIEWATGEFKVAKVLIAKEDCVVGDHWHRNKDETFYLLMGGGLITLGDITSTCGSWVGFPLKEGVPIGGNILPEIHVPRGTYHRFELTKGSILLGVGTEAFDPKDEISGRPPEPRYFTTPTRIGRAYWRIWGGCSWNWGRGWNESAFSDLEGLMKHHPEAIECDESGKILETPQPNIQDLHAHPDEIADIQGWNRGKIIEGGT